MDWQPDLSWTGAMSFIGASFRRDSIFFSDQDLTIGAARKLTQCCSLTIYAASRLKEPGLTCISSNRSGLGL